MNHEGRRDTGKNKMGREVRENGRMKDWRKNVEEMIS